MTLRGLKFALQLAARFVLLAVFLGGAAPLFAAPPASQEVAVAPARVPSAAVLRVVSNATGDRLRSIGVQAVIETLARHQGMTARLTVEPGERAVLSFKAGRYDADALRVARFSEVYPEAVRVDPHLSTIWYFAVTRSEDVVPTSWHDLAQYRIAYVRGIKAIDLETTHVQHRETPSTREACLAMVALGRVDVCILNAPHGYAPPAEVSGTRLYAHPFEHLNLYLWLAPGLRDLAARFSSDLKDMARSGELQRLMGPNRSEQ
ncbi:substrate-binding periplasmic protein [Roseateles koreensis]|uniref:Solute-binding protein family 3/N-terminal domain-containing protein n=1 Tax=Roseateles koreensis TaxID=2987526 RepID=A0ABT5KU30_9BURK|nr:hypothetical protein [Roseateles koreensis]MDC8786453.1 hypothetical protein [Roseateles koreensis]